MITPVILDCSATLAWLLPDEVTPESEALLDHVQQYGALVPNLWGVEVANSLLVAERRGRIDAPNCGALLETLRDLPIREVDDALHYPFRCPLNLAKQYHLTLYDALYFELALRYSYPLATRDKALTTAASQAKVALFF